MFLRVKKHGAALPETSAKTLVSFGGVEARVREGRDAEENIAGWTLFAVRQRNVHCVATRPAAWNVVWKPML